MLNRILLLGILLFGVPSKALEANLQVIATVNSEVITNLDIKKRLNLLLLSSGLKHDKKTDELFNSQILEIMIDEKLIGQEAERLGIAVSEEELIFALHSISEKNNMELKNMEVFLKSHGTDLETLKTQLKHQLYWDKIISMRIKPEINVNDQEIEESSTSIRASVKSQLNENVSIRLGEIVMYTLPENQKKVFEIAEKLVDDIKEGADFRKIAKEFSQASSAATGGEIGWVYVDHLAPQFSKLLRKAKPGFISSPINMPDGIYILKVIDTKQSKASEEELNQEEIKEMLLEKKLNIQLRAYIRTLRDSAYININKLK